MTRTLIAGLLALFGLTQLWAQPSSDAYQRIDGIVAVVGDEIVQFLLASAAQHHFPIVERIEGLVRGTQQRHPTSVDGSAVRGGFDQLSKNRVALRADDVAVRADFVLHLHFVHLLKPHHFVGAPVHALSTCWAEFGGRGLFHLLGSLGSRRRRTALHAYNGQSCEGQRPHARGQKGGDSIHGRKVRTGLGPWMVCEQRREPQRSWWCSFVNEDAMIKPRT